MSDCWHRQQLPLEKGLYGCPLHQRSTQSGRASSPDSGQLSAPSPLCAAAFVGSCPPTEGELITYCPSQRGGLVPPPLTLSGYTAMAFIGCKLSTSFHFYCCCIGQIPQLLHEHGCRCRQWLTFPFTLFFSAVVQLKRKTMRAAFWEMCWCWWSFVTFLFDLWPDFAVQCGYWWWWWWWCLLPNTTHLR